jgi:O-antigen/teichoic acid export membrane protein
MLNLLLVFQNQVNKKMPSRVANFFEHGLERSIKAKKNIIASFVLKGLSIFINILLVRLTINYLNPTKYGIWITLSSVIGWFGFFDIGLGNGLRNRFAEALANNNNILAKTYVSTTYAVLSLIIIVVLSLFYIINPFLNWTLILNTGNNPNLQRELSLLALIVFSFFCISFIFKLIATILTADQQPAKASLFDLCANVLSLFFVIILTNISNGSLLYLGIIFSSMPVVVFIISSLWFYSGKYKFCRPEIKFVDFSKAKDLFSLGAKFFIIQIAGLLLYQTNNIIISQLF